MNCKVLKYILVLGLAAIAGLGRLCAQVAVDFTVFSSTGGVDTILVEGNRVFCDWNIGEPLTETFGSTPDFDASKKRLTQGFEQGEGFIEDPFAQSLDNENWKGVSNGKVCIYPNPVCQNLHVVLSDEINLTYTLNLRNLQGGVVRVRQQMRAGAYTLDMARFPAGIYVLEVEAAGERRGFKVVKVQ